MLNIFKQISYNKKNAMKNELVNKMTNLINFKKNLLK